MEQTASVNLYDDVLVLAGTKLLYQDQIIYDFEDRYRNVSALSLEGQLQIFNDLVKVIYNTALPDIIKAEMAIIFARLMKTLSESNASSAVLSIGDGALNASYAHILRLFRDDNKLYDLNNMASFSGKYFSVILINCESVKPHFAALYQEARKLIKTGGQIICFGADEDDVGRFRTFAVPRANLYPLHPRRTIICADMPGNATAANGARDQVIRLLHSMESDMQYILSNRPVAKDDEWHRRIDALIAAAAETESVVANQYTLFENMDLKYQANEFKNALLDFKYEAYLNRKHYVFFRSALWDCYNSYLKSVF